MRGWSLVSEIGWVRGVGKFAVGRMLMKTHSRLLYNLFRGKQTKRKITKSRERTLMGRVKAHTFY